MTNNIDRRAFLQFDLSSRKRITYVDPQWPTPEMAKLHQDLGPKHAGNHSYTLVPKGWASGTYIVQIEALGSVLTQQITYLK